MEVALEAGAEDVVTNDDQSIDVMTAWEGFASVKDAIVAAGLEPDDAEITMLASITVPLDKEGAEKALALIDSLEDLDDVQNVYTNADISLEVMEQLDS